MKNALLDLVKKSIKSVVFEVKAKDIYVKSDDRKASKSQIESYFKKNKIRYKSVRTSKADDIDVLKVEGYSGDIVFKPLSRRGKGGVDFESELRNDLVNYFRGFEKKDLQHADVIQEMERVLKISAEDKLTEEPLHEGPKNQKRALTFTGELSVSNSTGKTLTDITLTLAGKNKPYYLSLKTSKTYYILSGSIGRYFLNPQTNSRLCEYLGIDGQKMASSFGDEYFCVTHKPNYGKVEHNLSRFMSEAYGENVVIIHKKKDGDVMVSVVKEKARVEISGLRESSYLYPEAKSATSRGRKHANIQFHAKIDNHDYTVNFQFRGTTSADKGPKYLRILMERL